MALQFQAPNIQIPDKLQAFREGLDLKTVPELYMKYKLARMEHELNAKHLDLQTRQVDAAIEEAKRAANSKYGTGEPAPTIQPSMTSPLNLEPGGPGSTLNAGPAPESPLDMIDRVGTDRVDTLAKLQKNTDVLYVNPANPKQISPTPKEGFAPIDSKTLLAYHGATTPGAIIKTNPDGTYSIDYTQPGQKNTVLPPEKPAMGGGRPLPTPKSSALDALQKAKTTAAEVLDQLLTDAENGQNGQPRKLVVGPTKVTARDFPGSGLARAAFTSDENQQFFGKVRKELSDALHEATGAQRSVKEIQFLTPASPTTTDKENVFVAKTVDAILSHAINMRNASRVLSTQKYDTSEYQSQLMDGVDQAQRGIEFLKKGGFDTSSLEKKLTKLGESGGSAPSFQSVAEAEAANLPKGTEVSIGGRRAVIE